jgi:hypothetical protein
MTYIANYNDTIQLPWELGLLEWLQEKYPHSRYRIVTR